MKRAGVRRAGYWQGGARSKASWAAQWRSVPRRFAPQWHNP
jgi:hypothetical protein